MGLGTAGAGVVGAPPEGDNLQPRSEPAPEAGWAAACPCHSPSVNQSQRHKAARGVSALLAEEPVQEGAGRNGHTSWFPLLYCPSP